MLECKFVQNWLNLIGFWLILLRFSFFRCQNFEKWNFFDKIMIFSFQNFVIKFSNLCDGDQKFWHRLVHLEFHAHSQTSPTERSHSCDMISWKNHIQIRHIGPQNVETKSAPKISWKFHGQQKFDLHFLLFRKEKSFRHLTKTSTHKHLQTQIGSN